MNERFENLGGQRKESRIITEIYNPEKVLETAATLQESLDKGDFDKIKNILADPKICISLVLNRGKHNSNLVLLENSVAEITLKQAAGPDQDFSNLSPDDGSALIKSIHDLALPEQVLNELGAAFYHMRDKNKFDRLLEIIRLNRDNLENPHIFSRSLHNLASWLGSSGDRDGAVRMNKTAMDEASRADDKTTFIKSKYGLSFNKDLLSKQKAEDFSYIAKEMEKLGDLHDSSRAKIEQVKALVNLSGSQSKILRIETLDYAEKILKDVIKFSKEISDPVGEIRAWAALDSLFKTQNLNNKAYSARQTARKLSEDYSYITAA